VSRSGGLWPAIAWAEALLALALLAVVFAVASTISSCGFLSGCEPGETSYGAASILWLVVAGCAAATGISMASWASGWRPPARAVLQATAAFLAGAAALWLGWRASIALVDEYLPALVLGVGVAGIVAIRPSSARAISARLAVLGILVLLALGMANIGVLVIGLALLTLPAMGAVESALRSGEPG
jgi:hypothetical protein